MRVLELCPACVALSRGTPAAPVREGREVSGGLGPPPPTSQPDRTHPGAGERREAALSHPLRAHLSSTSCRVSAAPRSVLGVSRFTSAALWVPRRPQGALESAPQPEPRSFSCDKVRGQRVGGRAPESLPSPSSETRRQSRPAPLASATAPASLVHLGGKGILKLRWLRVLLSLSLLDSSFLSLRRSITAKVCLHNQTICSLYPPSLHTVLFYPEKNFQIVVSCLSP